VVTSVTVLLESVVDVDVTFVIVEERQIMKTQSAKAKGRRFQQWVRDKLIEVLDIHPEDIESRSMGAGGEDLIMARAARETFPYSIECKNQEKINLWESYKQATENSGKYEPVVFIKRNNHKPLVVVDADYFINLHKNT
jgi:hypothetical protein|tara:strand:- start:684 stop:1100 length:417 start_codon:yes stop_codon:yes gene_type:complete